ncbi:MAG: hypothetical protein ACI9NN_002103 [Bacteroidia bacterium]
MCITTKRADTNSIWPYTSLKDDGFNVVRDKVNLKYKGMISDFMHDIGEGRVIIVALSDKYLKSQFCMFELYEIYRNSKMDKDEFSKKLFPIRVEELDLADPEVIDSYLTYWKNEEEKWTKLIKENGENLTTEQSNQHQIVKRIVTDLGNLLFILSDMNALNINALSADNFAEMKAAIRQTLNNS